MEGSTLRDLTTQAEQTIHECILSFDRKDSASFEAWGTKLAELEREVRAEDAVSATNQLLARLWGHRICMAGESERFEVVLSQSRAFLDEFSSDRLFENNLMFAIVTSHRLTALHALERHDEEREELLTLSRDSQIHGSDLLMLFKPFVQRHPGKLDLDDEIRGRLIEGVKETYDEPEVLNLETDGLDGQGLVLALAAAAEAVNRKWESLSDTSRDRT